MLRITLEGERLSLWPERGAFWERAGTLLIADVHAGKTAAFRQAGIPVPESPTQADLARLARLIDRTGARRVVFLGDLIHARHGRTPSVLRHIADWRQRRRDVEMLLVRGNHDVRAGDPPGDWSIQAMDGPVLEPPFVFRHEPEPDPRGYVLAGHLHPAAILDGPAGQVLRAPCFWFARTPAVGVLPAFGSFTGSAPIRPGPDDGVYVVGPGAVVSVGAPCSGQPQAPQRSAPSPR